MKMKKKMKRKRSIKYLLQLRHECIVNCVGIIDVISTSFLKHAIHILAGL